MLLVLSALGATHGVQWPSLDAPCATGLKYPMPPSNNDVDRHQPVDYGVIAKGIV